jgi:hypothetical protein
MIPIAYDKRSEEGWKLAGYYRDCREAKWILFICTNYRYQRDELMSEEACEELRKRADKEIADAEKKSAIKRKLEQVELEKAKAQDKEKAQAVSR